MATINNMIGAGNLSMFNNYSAANNRNSLNALWQNYSNFNANAMSAAAGLSEIRTNASAVMESYDTAKQTFYTEFDDTMSALKDSAAKVKDYNFNVGENAITTKESVDSDGNKTTTTTYSDSMKNALSAVKDFVSDYNDSIKFFNDNAEVSGRVSRMGQNFGDTTYRASNYESIGISVGKDGTLTIDEDALAKAINENPNRVSSVLGRDGLAGKAEQHVDTANAQRDRLFPDAKKMLGNQLDAAALYTGKAFVDMTTISNMGNLVNMMF